MLNTILSTSQGAALMHNAVSALSQELKDKTIGGILFGDTKNEQSSATIEGYPKENLASFCNADDGVCWGELRLSVGHFSYMTNGDVQKAAEFLIGKIDNAIAPKA
jgi:cutinase